MSLVAVAAALRFKRLVPKRLNGAFSINSLPDSIYKGRAASVCSLFVLFESISEENWV